MFKKTIITACLVAFATVSHAQAQEQVVPNEMQKGSSYFVDEFGNLTELKTPMFSFEQTEHDFGNLPEGPKAGYVFKFTNVGAEPLVIANVQASCGCTQPTWSKDPVAPGKTGEIFVEYNTQGRPGSFSKAVTISSNATEPSKVIFIKGKVEPLAQPTPEAPAQH